MEAVGVLLSDAGEIGTVAEEQARTPSGKGKAAEVTNSRGPSQRLKPWMHVYGLKQLSRTFASCPSDSSQADIGVETSAGKQAREWFETRRFSARQGSGAAYQDRSADFEDDEWEHDLETWFEAFELGRERHSTDVGQRMDVQSISTIPAISPLPDDVAHSSSLPAFPLHPHPLLHLPSLLMTLGPSSLTIFRFLLARKRVLVLAKPPVETVGVACWALASLASAGRDDVNVLGVVTLHDIDNLKYQSSRGDGWIACTTDTLFVEKTDCWDLLVDITNVTLPSLPTVFSMSESQPTPLPKPTGDEGRGRVRLYAPKATFDVNGVAKKSNSDGLTSVRFTWSDVKLVRVF